MPPRLPPCSVRRCYSWVLRLRLLFWLARWAQLPRSRFLSVVCCPGFLAGCSWFLPGGRFPFCWLLSGSPGFQSFFSFSSAQISLSLCPSCSSISPLGLSWLALVSVLATFVAWIVPRHLLVAYLLVSLRLFTVIFRSLFTTFLVGSSSSAFAGRPSSPFFWIVRGVGCSSWLSPLPGYSSSSSQFPAVWWVLCFLPCGPAPGLSLWPVGCSPVSSVRARSCVLSWTLGFSIPLPITSSWAPLSRFSSSTASSSEVLAVASGSCLSAPRVCFILLSLTTCLLFLFLGTAFPSAQ